MDYTYEELRKKTVAELRDIAKTLQDASMRGYTQLHKAELLPALCEALGVEMHEHHEVVGLNKSQIKAKIRELKSKREAAIEAHDHAQLREIRRGIHGLKRQLRRAMV